jgi:RNA polymerase sigma factor (sigma-70 family)
LVPEHSDGQLIAACTQGEAWAWEALVDRYRRLVYSIPLRVGLAPEDAADVFQTVFTLLLRRAHTLRDPQGLAKWLITTAKRESWNVSRKRTREPANDETVALLLDGQEQGVDKRTDEGLWMDQALIREGLTQLGGHCQEMLELLYYDEGEPSYEEIGRRLNMPVGSIGPNRTRCLAKLRKILEALGMN